MLPRRDVRAYDVDNDSVNKSNLQSGDFIGKHYIYIYIYIYMSRKIVVKTRFPFILEWSVQNYSLQGR